MLSFTEAPRAEFGESPARCSRVTSGRLCQAGYVGASQTDLLEFALAFHLTTKAVEALMFRSLVYLPQGASVSPTSARGAPVKLSTKKNRFPHTFLHCPCSGMQLDNVAMSSLLCHLLVQVHCYCEQTLCALCCIHCEISLCRRIGLFG